MAKESAQEDSARDDSAQDDSESEGVAAEGGASRESAKRRTALPSVSVWAAPPKERKRGTAPSGLTRQKIVRAAIALLDAEGEAGFSMRRLATELGVTPMSVYWYVDNKSDLLELALDEALGEMRIAPLTEETDWRDHLRAMAHEYRAFYQRHLWAVRIAGEVLPLGPNALFFSTSAISAIERTGLPPEQYVAVLGLVFQFVYGFATSEGQQMIRIRAAGVTEDAYMQEVRDLAAHVDETFVENSDRISPPVEGEPMAAKRNRYFADSLELALDGIEARVVRDTAGPAARSARR
ncbi:AcrR family transcriptional regulator [Streptacidiphilus sp. BW17]|uniref:TetR/AcrR family transcriptional regulator n=1 Tax=Streptacidiphilus sp. BW17 TaxID=3156274 RepID=UPI0035114A5F